MEAILEYAMKLVKVILSVFGIQGDTEELEASLKRIFGSIFDLDSENAE